MPPEAIQCPFELIVLRFNGTNGKDICKYYKIREVISEIETIRPIMFYSNSYSGEYVISGFADRPVGTDMEQHNKVRRNSEVLDWMFSTDTYDFRKQCSATLRWTLHEAIGKMEGVGLSKNISITGFQQIGQTVCRMHFWNIGASREIQSMNFAKFRVKYKYETEKCLKEADAYCTDFGDFHICVILNQGVIRNII